MRFPIGWEREEERNEGEKGKERRGNGASEIRGGRVSRRGIFCRTNWERFRKLLWLEKSNHTWTELIFPLREYDERKLASSSVCFPSLLCSLNQNCQVAFQGLYRISLILIVWGPLGVWSCCDDVAAGSVIITSSWSSAHQQSIVEWFFLPRGLKY